LHVIQCIPVLFINHPHTLGILYAHDLNKVLLILTFFFFFSGLYYNYLIISILKRQLPISMNVPIRKIYLKPT
jgi:hypothetical protein